MLIIRGSADRALPVYHYHTGGVLGSAGGGAMGKVALYFLYSFLYSQKNSKMLIQQPKGESGNVLAEPPSWWLRTWPSTSYVPRNSCESCGNGGHLVEPCFRKYFGLA